MTCIAAISDGTRVVMGADSASVSGWSLTSRSDEKVFLRDGYLIGFTTSFRMGQILRYEAMLPEPHGDDLMRFMVREFVGAIRQVFAEGGFSQKKDSVEHGGTFLVAFGGHLFAIDQDFQVCQSYLPFHACGCGADIAFGAMHALSELRGVKKPELEAIVGHALAAAEAGSAGVRGPLHILSTAESAEL